MRCAMWPRRKPKGFAGYTEVLPRATAVQGPTLRELRECCSMCQELRSTTRMLEQKTTLLASKAERL
jgi:hypothetical protein